MNKLLVVAFAGGCWSSPPPQSPPVSNKAPPRVEQPAPPVPKDAMVEIEYVPQASPGATGGLVGRVSDVNDEPLSGTTVVITSTVLTGEQTAITDDKGNFMLQNLPPGTYSVTLYYADAKFEHSVRVTDQHLTRLKVERWNMPKWSDER